MVLLFGRPPAAVLEWPARALRGLVAAGVSCLGAPPAGLAAEAAYLVTAAVLLPWLAMAALGRGRPADLGLRAPNRLGWRMASVALVGSLPFLAWMLASPGFAEPYLAERAAAGPVPFALFYLVNMACEHFLLHGLLLAALRGSGRWPAPPGVAGSARGGWARALQWLGLAQPTGSATGGERLARWLGLAPGCLMPILVSGLLFAAVHLGKHPRELLLAAPGGVALAFIAYRANSFAVPFALHVATAGAAWAAMSAPL